MPIGTTSPPRTVMRCHQFVATVFASVGQFTVRRQGGRSGGLAARSHMSESGFSFEFARGAIRGLRIEKPLSDK
ncbi:hypothetical protein [Nakamurella aerolata]|uniref:Uncharacterized protein n=1 Tax=Nakamurella aerolata TaxID=1656892 RepID=A0A849A8H4_9ACTN|nr:hypothetical protein [Nakamurella aerolata]NNG36859.1 hypothetical protein [Nakamurella aerolata]